MKCLVAVVLAVILVAAEGKAVPDTETQPAGTQSPQLMDHIREAQTRLQNLGTQIQEQLNLPKTDEVVNTIKEQSTNFANSIQDYVKNMTDAIKDKEPELENLWTNMRTKFSEITDKLAINPETTDQVNTLNTKLQEGFQSFIKESGDAAKAITENSPKIQEDFAKFTKNVIDTAMQFSQNLNSQLQQSGTPQS